MQYRCSRGRSRTAKLIVVKIDFLRERLGAHVSERSGISGEAYAAVAMVFREGPRSVEVLLIERAEREGDPWSGHMAFPGGRLEPGDESTLGTARRETFEEVGVELANAEYLGQLDDIVGNPRTSPTLVVAAHAFFLAEKQSFELAPEEVQAAFWFPLADMLEESRSVEYEAPHHSDFRYPGILVGIPDRHVVWGLTYRFVENLLSVLGHSIPGASPRS
jgi:8-oxo-dGTP pyrophosphatase MutT (NUDIX family)